MTILMHDAVELLTPECRWARDGNSLFDLLYADDTLLLGCDPRHVEAFAQAVERAGATYGMILHWGKTPALSVGTSAKIRRPEL